MVAASVLVLAAAAAAMLVGTASATWPTCVENADYTGGFTYVSGFRCV